MRARHCAGPSSRPAGDSGRFIVFRAVQLASGNRLRTVISWCLPGDRRDLREDIVGMIFLFAGRTGVCHHRRPGPVCAAHQS